MITRFKEREQIVIFIYHHLLLEKDSKKSLDLAREKNFSLWQKKILVFLFESWGGLVERISKRLKTGWDFSDLPNLDRAIMLVSLAEHFSGATVERKIAISEGVRIAKKFSDLAGSRYVNAILDQAIVSERKR